MEQKTSSGKTGKRQTGYRRLVPFSVIKAARYGDIDALTLIQRHFDPYMRKIAMVHVRGMNYLDIDLYERLKTKLVVKTLNFKLKL